MATLGKTTTPSTPTFGWFSQSSHPQVAMAFTTTQDGTYNSVSFWAAGSSALTIHGVIWSGTGSVLAFGPGVSTSGGSASGTGATQWYTDTFSSGVFIASGTTVYIGWQANSAATVDWAYNGNDHSPNAVWNGNAGSTGQTLSGNTGMSPSGAVAAYTTYTPSTAPVVSSASTTHAAPGSTITISGSGFTGASRVTFGSTGSDTDAASFTINSDTSITATLPTSNFGAGPINIYKSPYIGSSSFTFYNNTIFYGTGSSVSGITNVWVGTGGGGRSTAVAIYVGTTIKRVF